MSAPTVRLTLSGIDGIAPDRERAAIAPLLEKLPVSVRLGRLSPPEPAKCPRLSSYLSLPPGAPVPDRTDWWARAKKSIGRMYANDRLGCCVISGKAHALGVWSANDSDSGGEVEATDAEVIDQYRAICGPRDQGCYIPNVLEHMIRRGLRAGGREYRLAGYASVDHRDREQVKTAIHLFGSVTFGLNLPRDWPSRNVWDVSTQPIVGGHDVTGVGYDESGVYVSSWGRVYLLTWAAVASDRHTEELYALLAPLWTGSDQLAACGVDVAGLSSALAALAGGVTPPIPEPKPPTPPPPTPPPKPPGPEWPTFDFAGEILGETKITGTLTPRPATTSSPAGGFAYPAELMEQVDGFASALNLIPGVVCYLSGGRLEVRREGIDPERWARILELIELIARIIGDLTKGK